MSYENKTMQTVTYEYDFAVDGGDVGAIDLRPQVANLLEAGLVVTECVLDIETALVSGSGSATIGDDDDADGFFVDLVAATGVQSSFGALGGAYQRNSDTSVETKILKKVLADKPVLLTIGTGALTAGKFKLTFVVVKA